MRRNAWTALGLVTVLLAGCFGGTSPPTTTEEPAPTLESELADAVFDTTGPYSRVLTPGPHDVEPMQRITIEAHDGIELAGALWMPDVAEGERVPVILVISPYFSTGLYAEDTWTREFFLHSFVPHGYAFAKVAVRGTSFSDGCMESMGPNEQKDMDTIVTWFGTQPWGNGNVSIIGLSYVGTTPWAAAQWGNPHLKTIVPMSGVTSWFELGFRNGTAEPRTPIHMALYWGQFGVANQFVETPLYGDDPAHLVANVCEEAVWSVTAGPTTNVLGAPIAPRYDDYWTVRDYRERVAENYEGSILLVHGIRDWNVNIDMAVPFVTDLQDQGLEVKWLLGQWGHTFPDVLGRDEHVRHDFAEVLLRWFDVHLKGHDLDTGPAVDVEDSYGLWRTEDRWPPADVEWTSLHLGDGVLSHDEPGAGSVLAVNPAGAVDSVVCKDGVGLPPDEPVAGTEWRFTLGPLEEDLRFAGPVRLHATVTPHDAAGGELYAELWEVTDDEWYRAAHGAMNLLYHKGGHEQQAITPGEPMQALMEFYAADVLFKQGSRIVLRVVPDTPADPCVLLPASTGFSVQRPYVGAPGPLPITLHWGDGASLLHLPVVDRDVGDGRYPGQPGA